MFFFSGFDRCRGDFEFCAFSILMGFGGLGKCGVFIFHLSLSSRVWGSCCYIVFVFFLVAQARGNWNNNHTTQSLVDRRGGIEDAQHCIDIAQGQEERIPET